MPTLLVFQCYILPFTFSVQCYIHFQCLFLQLSFSRANTSSVRFLLSLFPMPALTVLYPYFVVSPVTMSPVSYSSVVSCFVFFLMPTLSESYNLTTSCIRLQKSNHNNCSNNLISFANNIHKTTNYLSDRASKWFNENKSYILPFQNLKIIKIPWSM